MKRHNVFGASARTSLLPMGLGAKIRDTFDGVFRTRIVPHHPTGEVLVERTQPDRGLILEQNQQLRNEPEALRKSALGTWICQIPFEDMEALVKANPELRADDRETRKRAWNKFLRSPTAASYRVRD